MNRRSTVKRNEILDTASQLFARHGYQGTNMKLLAKEAQASTSTIYSYFRDKTDLLSQSIERRLEALENRHMARLQEIEDPVEALLQGIGLLNEGIAEDPLLSSLMVYDSHVSDLRIRSHVRRVVQRVDEHNVALVRKAIDQGVITFEDPQALVTIFRLTFQGWLLNRQYGEKQLSQEQLTLAVKRLILELINDD
jgi:AcrR family transcriptional regulator